MNYIRLILLLLLLSLQTYSGNRITYQEPVPDAKFVSINNNIIIGFEKQVTLTQAEILKDISVSGSRTSHHNGTVTICSDKKKILFTPDTPFEYGESVNVRLTGKLISIIDASRSKYEFSFSTSSKKILWDPMMSMEEEIDPNQNDIFAPPQLTVTIDNNPSPGSIFLGSYNAPSYLIITSKDGIPYWYSQINSVAFDFKKQPNGHLTYYQSGSYTHYEMDANYNVVNSYQCGNGYDADGHDLRLLSNGHALLMAYDPEIVDMSHIIQGGNPQALVIGLIIQELDENKNVVFQWRSWDHIPITDALHENLTAANIDYVHGNAIEIDNDNNLMISSRHLDAITKINRTTGDIIWHLGGLENQFTFTNDTIRFTYQHAVRRIPNGDITIFDNGNFHNPPFTRVIEYSLNETNRTATLVWEYRHNPSMFSPYMGYAQRLSGGNTLIGWGGTNPTVTEITQAGNVVFEMTFPEHIYSYRAYKFDWNGGPVVINNQQNGIPSSFRLNRNYPNPFNPATTITYDIPKASPVALSVFDVTGKELKKLVSEYKQPGSYRVTFDGSLYSSGLYFYRLTAGDFTAAQKMILVK